MECDPCVSELVEKVAMPPAPRLAVPREFAPSR